MSLLEIPLPKCNKPLIKAVSRSNQFQKRRLHYIMYLSGEKRAAIKACIEKQHSNSEFNPGQNKDNNIKGFHDTAGERKISQSLFDASDGKEVFTPF